MSTNNSMREVKFKAGDRVKCIQAPSPGSYRAKLGEVLSIKTIGGRFFYSTADEDSDGNTEPCYDINLFKLYTPTIQVGGLL